MKFRARVSMCPLHVLPFYGEGRDGENGGVGRGFRGETLNDAERFAENVREV